jgi:hypothetical protein
VPDAGNVKFPEVAGIRELVPPPPSSFDVITVPLGFFRYTKESKALDVSWIAISCPDVPLNE